jgi:hypothetical protein
LNGTRVRTDAKRARGPGDQIPRIERCMPLIDAQQDRWTALIDANHRKTHVTQRCVSLNDAHY